MRRERLKAAGVQRGMLEADPVRTVRTQVLAGEAGKCGTWRWREGWGLHRTSSGHTTEDGGPTILLPAAADRCTLRRSIEYMREIDAGRRTLRADGRPNSQSCASRACSHLRRVIRTALVQQRPCAACSCSTASATMHGSRWPFTASVERRVCPRRGQHAQQAAAPPSTATPVARVRDLSPRGSPMRVEHSDFE
jgi:hypothetical protein